MRDARSRITVAAVAVLLGFLVVAQARSQAAGTGLENRSAQDLTLLVANLTTRNDQLRSEIATLERQRTQLELGRLRGDTSAGQVRADLQRIRMWAGLEPVEGTGIRIVVRGNPPAEAIGDLINELRNAGAEAIGIADVRVIPSTVVGGPAGSLSVENTPLGNPVEILAIGSSAALTGSLTRAGGVVSLVRATWPEVTIEVVPLARVTLPATVRSLDPVNGRAQP